jgi:hypothetical protein
VISATFWSCVSFISYISLEVVSKPKYRLKGLAYQRRDFTSNYAGQRRHWV